MIIKLAGMSLIFLSSCAIGMSFAECFAARERELDNLADGVELMIGELGYTMAPVRDIVSKVSPRVKGVCGLMFENMVSYISEDVSASKAWEDAIMKFAPAMSLKKDDALYLASCSFLLGAYEAEQQQSRLLELKTKILSLAREAGEAKKKNSKLVRMLGVYGGALLCVIMF